MASPERGITRRQFFEGVIALILTSCVSATETPQPEATEVPSSTPEPTATPTLKPSPTPKPTSTSTFTPEPTSTPTPEPSFTATLEPTPTPTRVPPTATKEATPTLAAKEFPPTPPEAPIHTPDDYANRDLFLNDIWWGYEEIKKDYEGVTRNYINAQGKLLGWRLEENRLIISMDTNKEPGGEREIGLVLQPGQMFGVWAERGYSGAPVVYQTISIKDAYLAMGFYFQVGDPISIGVSLDGMPLVAGHCQVLTWR